jgi:hypothetical protein
LIAGGPYTAKPKEAYGVKMAHEIRRPCDVDIPTIDFSVPDKDLLLLGMARTIIALYKNKEVYVGCMAGRGRTGLFMACLTQLAFRYRHEKMKKNLRTDAVEYVRANYYLHAVETNEQYNYVYDAVMGDQARKLITLINYLEVIPFFSRLPASWILWLTDCT